MIEYHLSIYAHETNAQIVVHDNQGVVVEDVCVPKAYLDEIAQK